MSSMLDFVKETQSTNVYSVLKIPPANAIHHSCDASSCASNIVIAHISGGSALDLV